MKINNVALICPLLAFLAFSTIAAEKSQFSKAAHGGGLSAAEIIAMDTESALVLDPEARVTVSISIPLVLHGIQLVEDVSGLPELENGLEVNELMAPGFAGHGEPAQGHVESAVITLPFSTESYLTDGSLNFGAMEFDLQELLQKFVSPSSSTTAREKNPPGTMNVLNQSNCGGLPLDTTLTISQDMGCLGTVENTYECLPNAATGGRDWYLTSSTLYPAEHDVICQ